MAIAIPPKLIMFEQILKIYINKKVVPTVSGRTIKTISDDLRCIKNRPIMITTIIDSSISVPFKVSTAFSIKDERSYTVVTSTPSTFNSFIFLSIRFIAE